MNKNTAIIGTTIVIDDMMFVPRMNGVKGVVKSIDIDGQTLVMECPWGLVEIAMDLDQFHIVEE